MALPTEIVSLSKHQRCSNPTSKPSLRHTLADDNHTYLPSGFQRVDGVKNPDVCTSGLTLLNTLPHFALHTHNVYALLGLAPGDRVLETGSLLGVDVMGMPQALGSAGRILGVKRSAHLLSLVKAERENGSQSARVRIGDLSRLATADASFHTVLVDRVLQFVPKPAVALSEVVRLLQPSGRLYACDNDLHTYDRRGEFRARLTAYAVTGTSL